MNICYPAIVHKNEDVYILEFIDWNKPAISAPTLAQVIVKAREALNLYISVCLTNYECLPRVSSHAEIRQINEENNGLIIYIDQELKANHYGRTVTKRLMVPERLIRYAEENKMSLSDILTEGIINRALM